MFIIKEYIKTILLTESKQSLINIGFPPVIASIMIEKLGNKAFIVAKWMRDYIGKSSKEEIPKDWFKKIAGGWGSDQDLTILLDLYNGALQGEEGYIKAAKEHEMNASALEEMEIEDVRKGLKKSITQKFFRYFFFRVSPFIEKIINGELTDLSPYKDLNYQEAEHKFESKRIFDDIKPIKIYPNGWKWLNVGDKCTLVGRIMKNCGSTGVMSMDPDSTMISLFDTNNTPHVVATYSPNEKRISGVEGQASTSVKDEYHDYILDLSDVLGVKHDITNEKSKELKVKTTFKNNIKKIIKLKNEDSTWNQYFQITLKDGTVWYSNGNDFIKKEELIRAKEILKKLRKEKVRLYGEGWGLIFSNTRQLERDGIKFFNIYELTKNY